MVCLFNSSDTVNQVYICSLLFFSLLPSPSIECHLPVLPRGTHHLSLQINNQVIPIYPEAQLLP